MSEKKSVADVLDEAKKFQLAERSAPEGFQPVDLSIPLQAEGDEVSGVYLGEVRPRLVADPAGNYRETAFFAIQSFTDGGKVEVLGSAILERFLEILPRGTGVWIRRNKQKESKKGFKLNDFSVATLHPDKAQRRLTEAGHIALPYTSYERPPDTLPAGEVTVRTLPAPDQKDVK